MRYNPATIPDYPITRKYQPPPPPPSGASNSLTNLLKTTSEGNQPTKANRSVFFFSDSRSNRFSPAKGEPRTKKKKNDRGGGEVRRQWQKPPAFNSLRFLKRPFQSCERRSLAYAWCDIFWGLKAIEKYHRYGLRKILSKHLNVSSWIK